MDYVGIFEEGEFSDNVGLGRIGGRGFFPGVDRVEGEELVALVGGYEALGALTVDDVPSCF